MRRIDDWYDGWQFALQKGTTENQKQEDYQAAKALSFRPVTLPHDFAISSPLNRDMEWATEQAFFDRWGIGWYKRTAVMHLETEKRYFLCFDGIYENSKVWVNSRIAGGRKYGYSSFSLDITDFLKEGENEFLVKADNTQMPADRWYSGAGIYRRVYLQTLPKVHFIEENIRIITDFDGGKAVLCIRTGMQEKARAVLSKDNKVFTAESHTEYDDNHNRDGAAQEVITLSVDNYIPWSAERPELYELKLQLASGEDEITYRIGFRKAELSADKGLLINGEKTKLKGVCLHQDAGCFGTAVTKELLKERLAELKKIGCNAIRPAHHVFLPQFLELCDEMGFYVYEECFDKWTGGAYGRYYQTEWEKDLACMVKRDRNHPCILFWGVGNEVENQAHASMLSMLEKHVAKIKEYDGTRWVSVAMNPHFSYPGTETDMTKVEDIQQFVDEMKTGEILDVDEKIEQIKLIAEKVDFLCCNYQEQWYDKIHEAIPDKAILGTETYMYFRGYQEKFQNFTEENPWLDVEKRDYCIGGMIWTGIDYLGESMGYPSKGWSGALFAEDMEKRPIAWQYQSYWTKEPMVRFAVMDYSLPDEGVKEHWSYPPYVEHWDFPQFSNMPIPFMAATNCQQVEIYVNEKEFLLKPTEEYPNHVVTGYLPYLPGKVTVIGKNDGVEACRHEVITPGRAVQLFFEKEEQEVVLERAGDRFAPYQMFLKVRAYDAENHPVFRESGKVSFSIEGPAQLIGVENGDMKSWEDCKGSSIHLYRGRACAAVRIMGKGRICVTARAAGMSLAQTVIVADAV